MDTQPQNLFRMQKMNHSEGYVDLLDQKAAHLDFCTLRWQKGLCFVSDYVYCLDLRPFKLVSNSKSISWQMEDLEVLEVIPTLMWFMPRADCSLGRV